MTDRDNLLAEIKRKAVVHGKVILSSREEADLALDLWQITPTGGRAARRQRDAGLDGRPRLRGGGRLARWGPTWWPPRMLHAAAAGAFARRVRGARRRCAACSVVSRAEGQGAVGAGCRGYPRQRVATADGRMCRVRRAPRWSRGDHRRPGARERVNAEGLDSPHRLHPDRPGLDSDQPESDLVEGRLLGSRR